MTQLDITYFIIFIAVFITIYHFYQWLFHKKTSCSCSGGCSIKADILKNVKAQQKVRNYKF